MGKETLSEKKEAGLLATYSYSLQARLVIRYPIVVPDASWNLVRPCAVVESGSSGTWSGRSSSWQISHGY